MSKPRTGFLPAPGMNYEDAFAYADSFGLDFVEIYAEGEPWRSGTLSDTDDVNALLEDHDLELMAHLPFPLDLGSPMPSVRQGALDALDDYLSTLAAMNAEKAVLHLNATSQRAANFSDEETREILIESASVASDLGGVYGIEVCAENLPGSVFTMRDFEVLFDQTEISMTLDTGHAILSEWTETEVASFIQEHERRISHVHLNDNRANHPKWRSDDEHLPFGAGTIDFEALLAPAINGDWRPTLSMEIVTWDRDYIEMSVSQLDDVVE
ncbi:MAG: sugar phosphate isomerase/epimerase family protein [Halobacteriaceae archaeon]